jgi:hypothetical protein
MYLKLESSCRRSYREDRGRWLMVIPPLEGLPAIEEQLALDLAAWLEPAQRSAVLAAGTLHELLPFGRVLQSIELWGEGHDVVVQERRGESGSRIAQVWRGAADTLPVRYARFWAEAKN